MEVGFSSTSNLEKFFCNNLLISSSYQQRLSLAGKVFDEDLLSKI